MIHLQNVVIWAAWKLSGKTKEQFSFMFNLAWFFNRSVLRSAWHALVEKTPNV